MPDRGEFQFDRESNLGGFVKPDIRRAIGFRREAAKRFISAGVHLTEIHNGLIGNGECVGFERVHDALSHFLQVALVGVFLVDLLRCQVGEQAHGLQVAFIQAGIRVGPETAEHPEGCAVFKVDRNTHMRADRNLARNGHGLSERIGGGVRDQLRQASLQDVKAVDF